MLWSTLFTSVESILLFFELQNLQDDFRRLEQGCALQICIYSSFVDQIPFLKRHITSISYIKSINIALSGGVFYLYTCKNNPFNEIVYAANRLQFILIDGKWQLYILTNLCKKPSQEENERLVHQHHGGIDIPLFLSLLLTTEIWHPSMSKSASVRVVESSMMCQGPWVGSHPPGCRVVGRQTSVRAVELVGTCEPVSALLGHGHGLPGER